MKAERLYISKLYLVTIDQLYEGIQDEEIVFKTNNLEPEYFTPGTAFYSWDKKSTTSGYYYANEIVYSVPGLGESDEIKRINSTGAVVAIGNNGRKLVMYRNDYFSNLKLSPEISSGTEKTQIKFSISSLDVL